MFGQNEMPGNLIMSFGGEVRVPVPESLLYVLVLYMYHSRLVELYSSQEP